MRILLAADPMVPVPPTGYGGIERIVDALARELRSRGHAVGLVARAGSTCEVDTIFPWPGINVGGRIDTMRNALAMHRAVQRFSPEIVHSFARLAYLTPLLPRTLPKVMSYQRHTGTRAIRPALRLARAGTLQFTGCSEFITAQGRAAGGIWHAIPNFIELDRIDFVPTVPSDAPLVFLSRVESIKGPDLAIAIARAAGRRLIIAGNRAADGVERDFWDQKIAPHLGHDGVEYIGEVDDHKKNALLGSAAALIVPIRWDEPFGIVFAESLAAGTPVISCARGALPEIVSPGVTGYFVQSLDEGVAAVRNLPSLDREACRRTVEARFNVKTCTDQYQTIYDGMLSEDNV